MIVLRKPSAPWGLFERTQKLLSRQLQSIVFNDRSSVIQFLRFSDVNLEFLITSLTSLAALLSLGYENSSDCDGRSKCLCEKLSESHDDEWLLQSLINLSDSNNCELDWWTSTLSSLIADNKIVIGLLAREESPWALGTPCTPWRWVIPNSQYWNVIRTWSRLDPAHKALFGEYRSPTVGLACSMFHVRCAHRSAFPSC